jgi:hypothetical protein
MFIHFERVRADVQIGRGYDTPDGYQKRAPFRMVLVLLEQGDGVGKIAGMLHRDNVQLSRDDWRDIGQALLREGIHSIELERHGKPAKVWRIADLTKAN